MIDLIFLRDYIVIMVIIMLLVLFLILGNLVVDILYLLIDFKIKFSKGGF